MKQYTVIKDKLEAALDASGAERERLLVEARNALSKEIRECRKPNNRKSYSRTWWANHYGNKS